MLWGGTFTKTQSRLTSNQNQLNSRSSKAEITTSTRSQEPIPTDYAHSTSLYSHPWSKREDGLAEEGVSKERNKLVLRAFCPSPCYYFHTGKSHQKDNNLPGANATLPRPSSICALQSYHGESVQGGGAQQSPTTTRWRSQMAVTTRTCQLMLGSFHTQDNKSYLFLNLILILA